MKAGVGKEGHFLEGGKNWRDFKVGMELRNKSKESGFLRWVVLENGGLTFRAGAGKRLPRFMRSGD